MHDIKNKNGGFKAICTLVCLPYSRVQLTVHLICNCILILFNLYVQCFACIYMVLGKNLGRGWGVKSDGVGMIDFELLLEHL